MVFNNLAPLHPAHSTNSPGGPSDDINFTGSEAIMYHCPGILHPSSSTDISLEITLCSAQAARGSNHL